MSSTRIFIKYDLQGNHWFFHSLMKLVYAVEFHIRKAIEKGKNDKNDNTEMNIIVEGALDKALKVTESL